MRRTAKTLAWCLIASVSFASGGCVSLRKKFVRKTVHERDQGPELFLELKDYGAAPTEETLRMHFVYAKGWLRELEELVMFDGNRKRIRKSIDAAIENVAQIRAALDEEGKISTGRLAAKLQTLRSTVYNPFKLNRGNAVMIVTDIKRYVQELKETCDYDVIKRYLPAQTDKRMGVRGA